MAYKFEDKFVHFRWDDSLKGKKCFVADSLGGLEESVEERGLEILFTEGNKEFPFETEHDFYRFVYYDPNYDLKMAYKEGKQIQISGDGEIWVDWEDEREPDWDGVFQFRIKPEKTYCVIVGDYSHLVGIEKPFVKEGTHVFYESDSIENCVDWINDRRDIENVMIAYAEGKEVEFLNSDNCWHQASTPGWKTDTKYRIKSKYRAFKNTDELKKKWEELCPTNIHRPSLCEPFIWVRCKANNSTSVIIRFAGTIVTVNFANYNLEELFRNFTFLDGTPCGIED